MGSALGAVPFVGPVLSSLASIGSGALQADAARKQAAQAANIRQQAMATQKEAIRPEYLAALHMSQMKALGGLPGMNEYQGNLGQELADQIRYIRMAAPGGNQALAAMSKAVAGRSAAFNQLQGQDMAYRSAAQGDVAKTLWDVGTQQRGLETYRVTQRNAGLTAASAMENAAMLNKQRGIDTALAGTAGGANQVTDNMMKLMGLGAQKQGMTTSPAQTGLYEPMQDAGKNYGGSYLPTAPSTAVNNWLMTTAPGQTMDSSSLFGASMGTGNTGFSNDTSSQFLPPASLGQ
jgi:hypothetical protein